MNPFTATVKEDINDAPAAGVYGSYRGGTSAAAAGGLSAYTRGVGVAPDGSAAVQVATPSSGRTVWYWLGVLVLLGVLIFAARKAGSAEDFRNIEPTAYNFITITLTSVLGIYALKVIFARWRVPGASDLVLSL